MKEFKTFGLSSFLLKKTKENKSLRDLFSVTCIKMSAKKKKKSQMRPGGIDKKSHPGGLPETDILLSLASQCAVFGSCSFISCLTCNCPVRNFNVYILKQDVIFFS